MNFSQMLSLLWSGTHNAFEPVLESEDGILESDERKLAEGDMILRPMDGKGPFYHVGIYCGESEVIDFVGQPDTSQEKKEGSTCCSMSCTYSFSLMDGKVSKVGVKTFLRNKMYRVLRLRCGIAKGFRERVRKAMNDRLKYNATTSNCLHFALGLLGQKQLLGKENDVNAMELQTMEEHKKLI